MTEVEQYPKGTIVDGVMYGWPDAWSDVRKFRTCADCSAFGSDATKGECEVNQDDYLEHQKAAAEISALQASNGIGLLQSGFGMNAAQARHQYTPQPQPKPEPNPALLLLGDDE